MKNEELEAQAMAYGDAWDRTESHDIYCSLAARDGFLAGYRAAIEWNRITDEDANLPSPGRLVLLAWEKDPYHDGKPCVDRAIYSLICPDPEDLSGWFWTTSDGERLYHDELLPSHWMYFPDPPLPEETP